MLLPPQYAVTATNWSDRCWAGFAPATGKRLFTAHDERHLLIPSSDRGVSRLNGVALGVQGGAQPVPQMPKASKGY